MTIREWVESLHIEAPADGTPISVWWNSLLVMKAFWEEPRKKLWATIPALTLPRCPRHCCQLPNKCVRAMREDYAWGVVGPVVLKAWREWEAVRVATYEVPTGEWYTLEPIDIIVAGDEVGRPEPGEYLLRWAPVPAVNFGRQVNIYSYAVRRRIPF